MTAIKIEAFIGEQPAVDDRLLPENAAATASNTWLMSGRIEPLHALGLLRGMGAISQSWFRMPMGDPGIDSMADSYWLEFDNPNVRVIRSPVVGQTDAGRYYWADGTYPKYMTGEMIIEGRPPFKLGIPTPGVAPIVNTAESDGTGQVVTRNYCYTWVSTLGEEGPPSPPTQENGHIDGTWLITMFSPSESDMQDRSLEFTRLYRTITSAQGIATFFLVQEFPISTLIYEDSNSDLTVAFNEQLESLYWSEPPYDLAGLVTMPNGMVAGWRSNEVWLCEPYHPHAWPVQYVISVDADIVGLGVYNQSLIILTDGQPYSATGVDPNSMALAKIQPMEICMSQRSIVSTPAGVLYASPNGLINITPAGAVNLTKALILKDQWNALLNLKSLAASVVMGGYYAYSTVEGEAGRPGVYISFENEKLGLIQLQPDPHQVGNVVLDIFNGETMISRDDAIYVIDVRKMTPYNPYTWRSKVFVNPYLDNMAAAKIYWTPPTAGSDTADKTLFRFYTGSQTDIDEGTGLTLRYERELMPSGQMYRLPSGYKSMYFQVEIVGSAHIISVHVASSARELRAV